MTSPGPVTKTLPALVPTDCGAKVRFNVMLWPDLSINGNAGPLKENMLPVIWKAESFTCPARVLVSTTACVELAPTAT